MKVDLTDAAARDLATIGDWIARDNPLRAVTFVDELYAKAMDLGRSPSLFAVVQQSRRGPVRKRVHGNYLIYYLIFSEHIEVLRVLHGAQRQPRFT